MLDPPCAQPIGLHSYVVPLGWFVAALHQDHSQVKASVNTAGVAQHIVPGFMVLPHTTLIFRMSLGLSDLYGDNRSVDGYGLDVDVLLPTKDANSPQGIIALAKTLAGE